MEVINPKPSFLDWNVAIYKIETELSYSDIYRYRTNWVRLAYNIICVCFRDVYSCMQLNLAILIFNGGGLIRRNVFKSKLQDSRTSWCTNRTKSLTSTTLIKWYVLRCKVEVRQNFYEHWVKQRFNVKVPLNWSDRKLSKRAVDIILHLMAVGKLEDPLFLPKTDVTNCFVSNRTWVKLPHSTLGLCHAFQVCSLFLEPCGQHV